MIWKSELLNFWITNGIKILEFGFQTTIVALMKEPKLNLVLNSRSDAKDDIRAIIAKISDVVKAQKASEKTLLDHEASRFVQKARLFSN